LAVGERLNFKGEKRVYQPRIRATRIHDLYEMKVFTGRHMTVLLDEALSIYLSSFMTSPQYTQWCEHIERQVDELREKEPDTDSFEDLSTYFDL
jgi:hypothetical protein